ncbi:hypothetical protein ONE63_011416 [Megalurothrips usitatus]|uniref:MADF domain-containing protein n=1 Tax=Megalurothrips usitatus TaxID=439358 RepID=A0AAV7X3F1_9NEOP|nr:hypothetical protein ONE63_011416 [Megalurothrips usitatus]
MSQRSGSGAVWDLEVRLIREVEKRPAIWDASSALHRNSGVVSQKWQEIAVLLNQDAQTCRKHFNALRANNAQNKRRRKGKSGMGTNERVSTYKYAAHLAFLDKGLGQEDTVSAGARRRSSSDTLSIGEEARVLFEAVEMPIMVEDEAGGLQELDAAPLQALQDEAPTAPRLVIPAALGRAPSDQRTVVVVTTALGMPGIRLVVPRQQEEASQSPPRTSPPRLDNYEWLEEAPVTYANVEPGVVEREQRQSRGVGRRGAPRRMQVMQDNDGEVQDTPAPNVPDARQRNRDEYLRLAVDRGYEVRDQRRADQDAGLDPDEDDPGIPRLGLGAGGAVRGAARGAARGVGRAGGRAVLRRGNEAVNEALDRALIGELERRPPNNPDVHHTTHFALSLAARLRMYDDEVIFTLQDEISALVARRGPELQRLAREQL